MCQATPVCVIFLFAFLRLAQSSSSYYDQWEANKEIVQKKKLNKKKKKKQLLKDQKKALVCATSPVPLACHLGCFHDLFTPNGFPPR